MNLLEAKAIVINECAREKRIVIRNVVIIAFLVVSVLAKGVPKHPESSLLWWDEPPPKPCFFGSFLSFEVLKTCF